VNDSLKVPYADYAKLDAKRIKLDIENKRLKGILRQVIDIDKSNDMGDVSASISLLAEECKEILKLINESDKQEHIAEYLKLVKPYLESATAQELFDQSKKMAEDKKYRQELEKSVGKTLPEGYGFYIDGAGIGHLTCPLYISNIMGE
jgi:hypothetical protein